MTGDMEQQEPGHPRRFTGGGGETRQRGDRRLIPAVQDAKGMDIDASEVNERKRLMESLLVRAKRADLEVCASLFGRRRWTVAWWQQRGHRLEEMWWTMPLAQLRQWNDDHTENILRKWMRAEWAGRGG